MCIHLEIPTQETGFKTIWRARESISGQVKTDTRETTRMIKNLAKANTLMHLATNTKVIGLMIERKAMES